MSLLTVFFLVFSAWSSFNSSHKYGNSHDFGNFLACRDINVHKLSTQYCLVQYFSPDMKIPVPPKITPYQNIWTDLDVSFLGAICLPSSCSNESLQMMLNSIFRDHNLTFGDAMYCRKVINIESEDVIENLEIPGLNWLNLKRLV